jgi:dienelactone hydrolase
LALLVATAPADAAVTDDRNSAFIEFELTPERAYVRQQVLVTARLFVTPEVLSSSFSDPVADGAIIKLLGEPRMSQVTRGKVRYEVFERRYALFPLRPGELRVTAPVFKGGISLRPGPLMPFGGRMPGGAIREFLASAQEKTISVIPAPVATSADWLPASKATLTEKLVPQTGSHSVGEPLTRTIELHVEGQLHTQLPPLKTEFPDGLKVFPDSPDGQSVESSRGVSAKRTHRWAIIPTREGGFELPEIRVPWWDVTADRARVAVIAARTINASRAPGSSDMESSSALSIGEVADAQTGIEAGAGIWRLVAGAAIFGWLVTGAAWVAANRRRNTTAQLGVAGSGKLSAARARLEQALRDCNPGETRAALIAWARARFANPQISGLGAVAAAAGSESLRNELARLDRALYSPGVTWDPKPLAAAMDWRSHATMPARHATQVLPALYPSSVGAPEPDLPNTRSAPKRKIAALLAVAASAAIALFLNDVNKGDPATPISAENYRAIVSRQEQTILEFLRAFEAVQDQIHPARVLQQQQELSAKFENRFPALLAELDDVVPPAAFEDFHGKLREALTHLEDAYTIFRTATEKNFVAAFFGSRKAFADGVYQLYDLRLQLPTVQQYWVLPDAMPRLAELEIGAIRPPGELPAAIGIIHRAVTDDHAEYSLYVPENYDPKRRWPLIITLHGSHGRGTSSLLTWLRSAKNRGYIVLAPKSLDDSWSIEEPEGDLHSISSMLADVLNEYAIDPRRIFATGLSDGGTFTYTLGQRCPGLFAGIAPIAGVLPPSFDLTKGSALPILIVHGGKDFIFPVQMARQAYAALTDSGFTQVTYQELPEWGHAFTYAINDGLVLTWFDNMKKNHGTGEGVCR